MGGFVRHPPSYRSDGLGKFIAKLDKHLGSKLSKHPRVELVLPEINQYHISVRSGLLRRICVRKVTAQKMNTRVVMRVK